MQVKKGKNRLLIKITQSNSDWGFACQFPLLVGGRLLMLDGETPHQNVVVQVLKDSRVFDTVLSDRTGRYEFYLPQTGRYTFRCQVLDGYIYYNSSLRKHKVGSPTKAVVLSDTTPIQQLNIHFHFAPFKKGAWRHYSYLDGLASNSVTRIYQAKDRTMWIGTTNGLSQFDGERFTNLTTEHGLVHNHILAIHQVSDGSLWIGTLGGVSHYDGQTFTNFTTTEGLVSNMVSDIHQSDDGMLWIATSDTETGKKDYFAIGVGAGVLDTMVNTSLA